MATKISCRDKSDIYNGCLNRIKSSLTAEAPEGKTLSDNGIEGIVGSPEVHDVITTPFESAPAWVAINLGKYYIYPTAYGIMGRRHSQWTHYLKGWNFFCKRYKGNWTLLSSFSNNLIGRNKIVNFDINATEPFNGFMIQMTQPDSAGKWALCLGQIEVFGDIITNYHPNRVYCIERRNTRSSGFTQMILLLVSCN